MHQLQIQNRPADEKWEMIAPNVVPVNFNRNNSYACPSVNNQNDKFNYVETFEREKFKLASLRYDRAGDDIIIFKDSNVELVLI